MSAVQLVVDSCSSFLPELAAATGYANVRDGTVLDLHEELGTGAFGTVSKCSLHGAAGLPLVVKVFQSGAANLATVAALHAALASAPGPGWPAHLRGVPFWAGTVRTTAGRRRCAWLGEDLSSAGLIGLADLLDDPIGWQQLVRLPTPDRLALAASLVEGYMLLAAVGFVHADINSENIMVDLPGRLAALIDVDSGVVAPGPGRVPLTAGKTDEFLAPELVNTAGVPDPALVTELSERWALGFAVGYLLLGTQPLFFLRNLGRDVLGKYAATYRWPERPAGALASPASAADYEQWRADADRLPVVVRDAFNALTGPGVSDPSSRPSAWDWLKALTVSSPPWFEQVTITPSVAVLDGPAVVVRWHAPLADAVWVEDQGPLPATGSVAVTPRRTGRLGLRARNLLGEATATTAKVSVLALPPRPRVTVTSPRAAARPPKLAVDPLRIRVPAVVPPVVRTLRVPTGRPRPVGRLHLP